MNVSERYQISTMLARGRREHGEQHDDDRGDGAERLLGRQPHRGGLPVQVEISVHVPPARRS